MDDSEKLKLVQIISNLCFVVVGLIIASVWFRIVVANTAVSPSLRKLFKLTRKNIATCLGAVLTIGLTVAVVMKQDGKLREASALFAWHPLAMTAATTLLFPASFDFITMRHLHKSASTRKNFVALHAFVQLLACVILGLGFAAIYFNKPADKHFLSLHSWVGCLALLFTALNYLGGALKSANLPFPKLLWKNPIHVFFGQVSFVFLCLATALGLYNKIILLPDGLNGKLASFDASWLQPGGTWSYSVLGGYGVYASLALLFWICYFALAPNNDKEVSDGGEKEKEAANKKQA